MDWTSRTEAFGSKCSENHIIHSLLDSFNRVKILVCFELKPLPFGRTLPNKQQTRSPGGTAVISGPPALCPVISTLAPLPFTLSSGALLSVRISEQEMLVRTSVRVRPPPWALSLSVFLTLSTTN